mmetsp:Transcript_55905/g.133686  ORF Transcript_55905/g.133686 Transcript_55905/m.133686 type:complete len:255 (+) Transcript_55905:1502-2266(+)
MPASIKIQTIMMRFQPMLMTESGISKNLLLGAENSPPEPSSCHARLRMLLNLLASPESETCAPFSVQFCGCLEPSSPPDFIDGASEMDSSSFSSIFRCTLFVGGFGPDCVSGVVPSGRVSVFSSALPVGEGARSESESSEKPSSSSASLHTGKIGVSGSGAIGGGAFVLKANEARRVLPPGTGTGRGGACTAMGRAKKAGLPPMPIATLVRLMAPSMPPPPASLGAFSGASRLPRDACLWNPARAPMKDGAGAG